MNRGFAAVLFILGSLLGGPLVFVAASLVVVNAVRGGVLFLQGAFDFSDFTYLPNALVAALAAAVIFGISQGLRLLAARTVGVRGRELAEGERPNTVTVGAKDLVAPYESSRRWLLVLFTLLVVTLLFSLVVGLWFARASNEELMRYIAAGLDHEFVVVAFALGAYMPFVAATFAMARVAIELEMSVLTRGAPVGRPAFLTIAWLLPPVVVAGWLIMQAVSGGLF